jgi:hypothetical protein
MAYGTYDKYVMDDSRSNELLACTTGALAAIGIAQAVAVMRTYELYEPIAVTRFGVKITTTMAYGTTPTLAKVALKKYPTFGSSSGAVTIAEFTIPEGTVAGTVLWVDVNNSDGRGDCLAGQQIVMATTVEGHGGTETGAYRPYFCYNPRAEVAGNQPYMTAATDLA